MTGTPTVVALPVVDPLVHAVPHANDENSESQNNPPLLTHSTSDSKFGNNIPQSISMPPINSPPSQPRNNFRNIFTPMSSNTSARGNYNITYQSNSQPSLDALIQSSPFIHLLKKNTRNIRPWSEFFNFYCFQTPSRDMLWARIIKNSRYFIFNYTIIYSSITLLCVILMPLFLPLLLFFFISHFILLFQSDTVYVFNLFSCSRRALRYLASVTFIVLFLFVVRPSVFFLLAATFITIASHSALHTGPKYEKIPDENTFDDV